jgi:transposase
MELSTIGLDVAKNVFQSLGIDAAGKIIIRWALRRKEVFEFFAVLRRV